ncbi:putative C6 transcription factor [Talaromyces proteolyticus]|uniref:C6 transcription factor n=1 Tax=Talaromyces proteolyticus TaxID=1131652 RepID=A0AAD4L125_9EURO|nr:putative C6 transcription factor [Talaromyces proteolyticus]KAH8702191.1 putative C6 transcription factor [Talaromyces proteolyticus]
MDTSTSPQTLFSDAQLNPPVGNQKSSNNRQRIVTSCLTCRRRKVKCDHKQPVCSTCERGKHPCSYIKSQPSPPSRPPATINRTSRPRPRDGQDEIRNRLERLEKLLEQAIAGGNGMSQPSPSGVLDSRMETSGNGDHRVASVVTPTPNNRSETLSIDGYDGALLLEAENGQSRWVSSLHYALLADEINDVKMLLGNQAAPDATDYPVLEQANTSFLFSTPSVDSLAPWLPTTAEDCTTLLDIFFLNVDPMTRLIHKPSLKRRFMQYLYYTYGTISQISSEEIDLSVQAPSFRSFEPLALAIFHSAVNSMSPEDVAERFSADKKTSLAQFQRGVEFGLAREEFLTTASIEVLQAFVLLLTCQSREDDMSKTWTLLGLVLRIALSQGLHREPSLFPSDNMDVVQVELRRRLWHQICHLDFRSAEGKGQEPTISDDDYTTLLPRNVNDEDLIEGQFPTGEGYSNPGFTDMTGQLVRLHGIHCFRRIVRSTYRLERRIKSSTTLGNGVVNSIAEFQALFTEVHTMVNEMVTHIQTEYLQYCDPQVPEQRLSLGLAAIIEWRCWSIFWLRIPQQYREAIVSPEIRTMVLAKSVSLMESMNQMPDDKDAKRFQWHIGGHACFQAILHIVSELKTPEFQSPNHIVLRTRALNTLERTKKTREHESRGTWHVINRIIVNFLSKNSPSTFPLTPFPDIMGILPDASPGTMGTTQPPQTMPVSLSTQEISEDTNLAPPSLDLANFGSLDMQDPSTAFDWGFWNLDVST